MVETILPDAVTKPPSRRGSSALTLLLLAVIVLVGGYFRFVGMDWDQGQHLHPDERFLTMVTSDMTPVSSLGEYFNTATSTLNPHNIGHGFYVYGDLPVILVRYIAQAINQTGYDQIYLVGRAVSAALDLLTILLTFLIAMRLFRDRRIALLAAAFDALAVLQIQLSHYFTVDIPANFFIFLSIYIAVRIQTDERESVEADEAVFTTWYRRLWWEWRGAIPYLLFGVAVGMALASKISAAPLVLFLTRRR